MSIDNQKLILTPNGYKAGKNYSIKPTDGSGDFTMSRGTSKTRVNKDKVIESVGNDVLPADYTNADCPVLAIEPQRTNLLKYSEEFDNAAWMEDNVTITPNDAVAPDGTTTADELKAAVESTDLTYKYQDVTYEVADYTISVYAKESSSSVLWLYVSSVFRQGFAYFDLSNQSTQAVAGSSSTPTNLNIEEVGNGWYRCSATFDNTTVNKSGSGFGVSDAKGSSSVTEGKSVYFWGAQLEKASTSTSYIPTTSSTVTRNQDILTNDLTSTIDASYSALIKVEADNSRLKIEDTDTGFDLPLNGTGNIAMVVDNQITFHFPDNGQENTTVTYDKPADLRNLEILSKLGRTGLAILSIENGVISQSKIDDWVSGTISSDWIQDYSTQTDFFNEFRNQNWDYFPAFDLSSGINFGGSWRDNNLTSFPAIDLSNGTNFQAAWFGNNLTSFPAIDLSSGTSFPGAWYLNNLTSFPAIDLSNGTNFDIAWLGNNLTSFPANMFDTNNASNYDRAFQFNALDQQSVDNILVSIEASAQANNITNGELGIDGGTNATPSATGQAAADSLRNTFNWTVELNGY